MSQEQIIEVGKVLLPYLRNDLTATELGTAAHDIVAALNRVYGIDKLKVENKLLRGENRILHAHSKRMRTACLMRAGYSISELEEMLAKATPPNPQETEDAPERPPMP